jgi:hypothetical protein
MPRKRWSREVILRTIRTLHAKGVKLCPILKVDRPLYYACFKYFGSWERAVKASGLEYEKISSQRPHLKRGKEQLIAEIRNRKASGLPINYKSVQLENGGLLLTARKCFGRKGWQKALRAAGFNPRNENPRRMRTWNKESIIAEIKRRSESHQPLNYKSVDKNDRSLIYMAVTIFGSWDNALGASGLDCEKIRLLKHRWWTRKRILIEIRSLQARGLSLNSHYTSHIHKGLFEAAVKQFGGWQKAVEAAGVDYKKYLTHRWSYKSWLEKLTPAQQEELDNRTIQLAKVRRKGS